MSPTERTLERLALWGFSACIVERYIDFKGRKSAKGMPGIRKDAFGIGDILAIKDTGKYKGVWLIQTTSAANHLARVKKAEKIPELDKWIKSGGRIAFVSWGIKGGQWIARWEERHEHK